MNINVMNGMEYLYRDMAGREVMPGRGRGRGRGRGVDVMPSIRYSVRRRLAIETGTQDIPPETTGNFILYFYFHLTLICECY
jgi:hypothetical protein